MARIYFYKSNGEFGAANEENFTCLIGTPKKDANGQWYCDTGETIKTSNPGQTTRPKEEVIKTIVTTSSGGTTDEDTILGFPTKTVLIVGGLAAGLLIFASMSNNKGGNK